MYSSRVLCELLRLFATLTILTINSAKCYNILWLAGVTSPSHQIWSGVLQKALAGRGHNITALSVDVDHSKVPNLTFIHLENVYGHFSGNANNLTKMVNTDPFNAISSLASYRADGCYPAFQSHGSQFLMAYPESFTFDLVVHDFAGAHCLLGFVPRFGNPPLVSLSATTCPVAISYASGNPQYPEYVPANHLDAGFRMGYLNRIYNNLLYAFDNVIRSVVMMPEQDKVTRKYFKDENVDVGAISKSSVLTLVNLPPYDVMQPFFQTVIPVGGLQIQCPKPLSEKLDQFISNFKDGIIYFALGTNIKSEQFSKTKVKYFLEAFEQFPTYGFLWKYDPVVMQYDLPKNVLLEKWLPQNDILALPKTKAFIGHGGALSCQEAIWYGIPQLLIPFIIDQKHNTARAVERGVALKLDHNELSTDAIIKKLVRLLYEPSFTDNAKSYSRVFRDQPVPPLEKAIFWIEYVLRNGHETNLMRSPGQDMTKFYQVLPDVIMATLVLLVVTMLALIFASTQSKSTTVNKT